MKPAQDTFQIENFDFLLKLMVRKNASDMFITAGLPPSLKVNGSIAPVTRNNLTAEETKALAYGVMNTEQRAEFELHSECNFALAATDIGRFRVNVFRQKQHIGMVLRKIETRIPTLSELGLPDTIRELAMTKRGLVLIVGATGSGKSTTLAAMVGHRNQCSHGHIITVEDPVEYIHEHGNCVVTQREVGLDTESFEIALRNTLRQAPDVILIGEIRTRETMQHAITFAETGHLCLATLHANNANQALDRIINFFPQDRRDQMLMDLSFNLKAIVAQQLIPTQDGKTRRAAFEIMLGSPLISQHILKGRFELIKDVIAQSTNFGMQTFDQALYDLYAAGEISYEDALRHADHPNQVRLMVKLGKKADLGELNEAMGGVTLIDPDMDGG